MSFEALPDGWRVWNEEPSGRAILVYRPDVFGGDDLPSACLPTIYLTNGARTPAPDRASTRPRSGTSSSS